MGAVGTAVGLAAGLCAIALACYSIAAMAKSRSLPLNGFLGIRTRATRRSEASWFAGHDAARPALLAAAVVCLSGATTTVLAGVALNSAANGESIIATLGLSSYIVVLVLLTWATVKANKAATNVGL